MSVVGPMNDTGRPTIRRTLVLLVEDDLGLARLTQRRLLAANYAVDHASDGTRGLALMQGGPQDAVILDYRLPGPDGLTILRRLREEHVEFAPTIMLSASQDLEVAVEAMKLGAFDYLVKDVDGTYLDLLPATIERALEKRRLVEAKAAAEAALARQTELLATTLENINQGLCVYDGDLKLVVWNQRFLDMLGYPADLARVGTPIETLLRHCGGRESGGQEGGDCESRALARLAQGCGHEAHCYEAHCYERTGSGGRVIEVRGNPMPTGGFVATYTDITERKQNEERIWRQANYDALTDLPNRLLFIDRLNHIIRQQRRSDADLALLFADLDGFKQVNDTLGHKMGDLLLKEVACRLTACVRATDILCRLGGDEFTILLTDVAQDNEVDRVAGKVLAAIAAPFDLSGHQAHVTVSIGIALFPRDGESADALLKHADEAMYAAKRLGKNKACFHCRAD